MSIRRSFGFVSGIGSSVTPVVTRDMEPTSADGHNFLDGTVGGFTESKESTATSEVVRGAYRCTIPVPPASTSYAALLVRAKALAVGERVIACLERGQLGDGEVESLVEILNSDATEAVGFRLTSSSQDTTLTLYDTVGGGWTPLWNEAARFQSEKFWLGLEYDAADTFKAWVSIDGEQWMYVASTTQTLTPGKIQAGHATWSGGGPLVGAVHMIDVDTA